MSAWPTVPLREVASIDRDGVDPQSITDGLLYVGLENIESGGQLLNVARVSKGELASTKFRFGPQHLLYGKLRPYLAKIALPTFEGICSTDILPVLPGKRLDRTYLAHFLRQPRMIAYATSRSEGINLPRLSPRALADFEFPLPPVSEQRQIAAILDRADDLRRKRNLALEHLDKLAVSYFVYHFGTDAKASSQKTEELGSLCELVRGSSPRPQGDPRFFGGAVPRLMIADITRDGMMVTPRIDSLTEEGAKRSRPMKAGSVVMAVSGAVGLSAILATDACIHDGFVGFRNLTPKLRPEFLYYWLQSERSASRSKGTGAIWINLTTDQVSRFGVPMPSIQSQEEFVEGLGRIGSLRGDYTAHRADLETLFASLQHRAFDGGLTAEHADRELAEVG